MIEKKKLIELLVEELHGGDAPPDTWGKYHPLTVEAMLSEVFADIVSSDPNIASDMAIEYTADVTTKSGKHTAILSKPPVSSLTILSVKSGQQEFYPVSGQDYYQLSKIGSSNLVKAQGKELTFSVKPKESTVTVLMVANFADLEMTDPVVVDGSHVRLFKAVYDLMRRDVIIQEKLNNSRVDG